MYSGIQAVVMICTAIVKRLPVLFVIAVVMH